MKMPRLNAQCAIGPSIGHYTEVAAGDLAAQVVAMGSEIFMTKIGPEHLRMLTTGRCPDGRLLCLGGPGPGGLVQYRCCDQGERCVIDSEGRPQCMNDRDSAMALTNVGARTGTSLGKDMIGEILSRT